MNQRDGDGGSTTTTTETSLDKIKRQLASGSGRNLLQGPLLKRSETVTINLFYLFLNPLSILAIEFV